LAFSRAIPVWQPFEFDVSKAWELRYLF